MQWLYGPLNMPSVIMHQAIIKQPLEPKVVGILNLGHVRTAPWTILHKLYRRAAKKNQKFVKHPFRCSHNYYIFFLMHELRGGKPLWLKNIKDIEWNSLKHSVTFNCLWAFWKGNVVASTSTFWFFSPGIYEEEVTVVFLIFWRIESRAGREM